MAEKTGQQLVAEKHDKERRAQLARVAPRDREPNKPKAPAPTAKTPKIERLLKLVALRSRQQWFKERLGGPSYETLLRDQQEAVRVAQKTLDELLVDHGIAEAEINRLQLEILAVELEGKVAVAKPDIDKLRRAADALRKLKASLSPEELAAFEAEEAA
jgi:Xaa-Pro aminopeptidase